MTSRHIPLKSLAIVLQAALLLPSILSPARAESGSKDLVHDLQQNAIRQGHANWGHWGVEPEKYSAWTTHSNRLIPVYTFGIDLDSFQGEQSPYRNAATLRRIYNRQPDNTLNGKAEYFDQTDIYLLQRQALEAGKKHIILLIFDGMDWQTTQAAAIYRSQRLGYDACRGTGLRFQDYRGVSTDYGTMVTSPYCSQADVDVNRQKVLSTGGQFGGYDARQGGPYPWSTSTNPAYLLGKSVDPAHPYTDSAASATSMNSGRKTYNIAVNIDPFSRQSETIAHLSARQGMSLGVVTSVPISHATPACAYSHNVSRHDYQDLSRDLLGLPSVSHPRKPLPGVDVLIGAGWGVIKQEDKGQGDNFVPGNAYLTEKDLHTVDQTHGGRYRVVQRTKGVSGNLALLKAAKQVAADGGRLFGFFGTTNGKGHLPYRTADGMYNPTIGTRGTAESYSPADLEENPTLPEIASAALTVLEKNPRGFWLMIEAGDVDWANHDNNLDNSIGAVLSGDEAFEAVTHWAEKNDRWKDTALIVTADHGHFLVLKEPEVLIKPNTHGPDINGEPAE